MMRQFLSQYKALLLALLLILIGLHLFSSSVDEPENLGFVGRMVLTIYEPIYKIIQFPFTKASGAVSSFTSVGAIQLQNEQLLAENAELKEKLQVFSELAGAAERYGQLLELKSRHPELVTYARIIARPASTEYRVFVIDKGEKDGASVNMSVVTPDGLVGHVVQTAPYASKVMLVTDAGSSVAATIQRTRANSLVQGQSFDDLKLKFLSRNEDVAVGDVVVTSGLGGVFPKGITVGSVSVVNKEDFGIFQDAEVKPAVDLARVEEVALLKVEQLGATELLPPEL
jgi:rod shape-determining protein MreC